MMWWSGNPFLIRESFLSGPRHGGCWSVPRGNPFLIRESFLSPQKGAPALEYPPRGNPFLIRESFLREGLEALAGKLGGRGNPFLIRESFLMERLGGRLLHNGVVWQSLLNKGVVSNGMVITGLPR